MHERPTFPRLTFLGSGTSVGVPTLGCDCAVCASTDPRDKRTRPSVAVRWLAPGQNLARERTVVIDTGPDFRAQALRENIRHVDAVLYTHEHADHILGMDDLRPLSWESFATIGPIPLYADTQTAETLERIYDYTFAPGATYSNRARVELKPIGEAVRVHEAEFVRVPVMHGDLPVSGFRFGDAAYLTDVSFIPESSFALLKGLETLVLPGLRRKPHPSHASLDMVLQWAARIGARQTWLTHISHDLGHEATNRELPAGVALAYDGLEVAVSFATGNLKGDERA